MVDEVGKPVPLGPVERSVLLTLAGRGPMTKPQLRLHVNVGSAGSTGASVRRLVGKGYVAQAGFDSTRRFARTWAITDEGRRAFDG